VAADELHLWKVYNNGKGLPKRGINFIINLISLPLINENGFSGIIAGSRQPKFSDKKTKV